MYYFESYYCSTYMTFVCLTVALGRIKFIHIHHIFSVRGKVIMLYIDFFELPAFSGFCMHKLKTLH